jgi:hypothetical protein
VLAIEYSIYELATSLVVHEIVSRVAVGSPALILEMVGAVLSLGDADVVKDEFVETVSLPDLSVDLTR